MALLFAGFVLLNLKILSIINNRYNIKNHIFPKSKILHFVIAIAIFTILSVTADSFTHNKLLFYGLHSLGFTLLCFISFDL